MIKASTIIFLFFSTLAFGQRVISSFPQKTIYKRANGLTLLDSASFQDIVGSFCISNGFCGYYYQLGSNMMFKKVDFCCEGQFIVDSGSWAIKNNNTIALRSNKASLYFDIVKFDDFYFFILPRQRKNFIADLGKAKTKLKNARPFKLENRTYSVDFIIGHSLLEKYYGRDRKDVPGT